VLRGDRQNIAFRSALVNEVEVHLNHLGSKLFDRRHALNRRLDRYADGANFAFALESIERRHDFGLLQRFDRGRTVHLDDVDVVRAQPGKLPSIDRRRSVGL
jgi:hypothetical protein